MKRKSLKVNFVMNCILTVSSVIFPLLTFRYISRILLPVGTGKVSFATSFISYFSLFAQLGIPTYGIRACAKVKDDRNELTTTVHELLVINLITCAITYGALIFVLMTVPRLQEDRTLYLVVSLTIFFNAIGMEWLYRALEEYSYITFRSIAFKLIALIATFLLVHKQQDYILYGGISIFASSASNVLNFIHTRKYIDFKPCEKLHIKRHLKACFIFFTMTCATTIYTHIDTVMLGLLNADEEVGFYDAATKIKIVLVALITSLGNVLLPRSSYYINKGNYQSFKHITYQALNFVFVAAAPLIVYFELFARPSILFLSGTAYENAIIPMRAILPSVLFIGLTNVLGIQILVPLGREKIVLCSEIVGAITNVVINWFLIPRYHSFGAAIGTVVAEAVVFAVQYSALRNEVSGAFQTVQYGKILIAVVMGSLLSSVTWKFHLSSFMTILCSACLYISIYSICLIVMHEPLAMECWMIVKKLFRYRKK